jgi:hypothetical protein
VKPVLDLPERSAPIIGFLRFPELVHADKDQNANAIRQKIQEHGALANIPPQANRASTLLASQRERPIKYRTFVGNSPRAARAIYARRRREAMNVAKPSRHDAIKTVSAAPVRTSTARQQGRRR